MLVLPAVIGTVGLYGIVHYFGWDLGIIGLALPVPDDMTLVLGGFGTFFAFTLFLCTGMIYACVRFLREWASWLTVANYALFGITSGFLLAAFYSAVAAPALVGFFAGWSVMILLLSRSICSCNGKTA